MLSVTCTNPSCRRAVPLPDNTPTGTVYACPACKQDLPPVPDATPEWVKRLRGPWGTYLLARVVLFALFLYYVADYFNTGRLLLADLTCWAVLVYVGARCRDRMAVWGQNPTAPPASRT
jgi:hypothetical protein